MMERLELLYNPELDVISGVGSTYIEGVGYHVKHIHPTDMKKNVEFAISVLQKMDDLVKELAKCLRNGLCDALSGLSDASYTVCHIMGRTSFAEDVSVYVKYIVRGSDISIAVESINRSRVTLRIVVHSDATADFVISADNENICVLDTFATLLNNRGKLLEQLGNFYVTSTNKLERLFVEKFYGTGKTLAEVCSELVGLGYSRVLVYSVVCSVLASEVWE